MSSTCVHLRSSAASSRVGGLVLTAAALAAGCRTVPPPVAPPVFYPPPPAAPRLQFLRTLASSDDVVPPPSPFLRFVLGEDLDRPVYRLVRPYGMAMRDGRLYVCDSGARVGAIFDFPAQAFRTFGSGRGYTLGMPVNVNFGPDREPMTASRRSLTYLADTANGRILVLGPDDAPVRVLSGPPGMRPCDVLWRQPADDDEPAKPGELLVADLASNSILVLDPRDGRLLRQFGRSGSAPGEFSQPTNLAVGPDGDLYVSDTLNARVQRLDRDGRALATIGGRGRALGLMVRPKGLALDREGRLYVCDAAAETVLLYDAGGRLLMTLGQPGVGPGDLSLPAKVMVTYDRPEALTRNTAPGLEVEYLVFVSNHLGPNKINVYGFLGGAR